MISRLLRRRWFPGIVQYSLLGVCLALLFFSWIPDVPRTLVESRFLQFTNLTNFLTWVIFKPGLVVVLSVLLGSVWCMVCPARAVHDLFHRVSLGLEYPAALRNLSILLALFFLHRVVMLHYDLHHDPFNTGLYILALLILPAAYGLLFSENLYCRRVCPMRLLIGLFSLCSPVRYGVKDAATCRACEPKPCRASCPNRLDPVKPEPGRYCLLCVECLKGCPKDNLGFRLEPALKGLLSGEKWTAGEVVFLAMLLGIAMDNALQGSSWAGRLSKPGTLVASTLPQGSFLRTVVRGLWSYLALPGAILALPWLLRKAIGRAGGFLKEAGETSRFFIPVAFAGMFCAAFDKASLYLSYWPRLAADPFGQESARAIAAGLAPLPSPLLTPSIRAAVTLAVIALAFLGAAYVLYKEAKDSGVGNAWSLPTGAALAIPTMIYTLRFL